MVPATVIRMPHASGGGKFPQRIHKWILKPQSEHLRQLYFLLKYEYTYQHRATIAN